MLSPWLRPMQTSRILFKYHYECYNKQCCLMKPAHTVGLYYRCQEGLTLTRMWTLNTVHRWLDGASPATRTEALYRVSVRKDQLSVNRCPDQAPHVHTNQATGVVGRLVGSLMSREERHHLLLRRVERVDDYIRQGFTGSLITILRSTWN